MATLTGTLSLPETLTGHLSGEGVLSGALGQMREIIGSLILPTRSSEEIYEGSYDIEPDTSDEQILPTKRKILSDDIVVRKIRYSETTNPSGGCTVFIG